jgi:hypothetical protein
MDEVAREFGVSERELWRALPWDQLDQALAAGMRQNFEQAARRLASAVPQCREVLRAGRKGG